MGRSLLWIQILNVFFMPDLTSGLQCLSCKSVTHTTDCHNATTCTEGEKCYISQIFSFATYCELGCMPATKCPKTPVWRNGVWGSSFLGCCDNGDLCIVAVPSIGSATPPPKITHLDPPFIAGNTFLDLHSTAYLYCWYNATRTVSTAWLFNGGSKLPPHAFADGSLILYIKNMTRSEVGNYTCVISLDGVAASASVWIYLLEANTPIGLPKFSGHPQITNGNMVVNLQSSASFNCASERNDVTYTWQFNGSATLPQHARLTHQTLYIDEMNVTEVGLYTCITSKTNGYASATSVRVSIKEEIAHVSSITSSPAHRPQMNGMLDIVCTVTGFPVPTIRWSFKDPMGLYYVPPNSTFPRLNMVHIHHFQPSLHSGTWTCMVRNSLGADQKSIDI